MFEYDPKLAKKKERILLFAIFLFSALMFGASMIQGMPYPAIFQLFCVVGCVFAIMLLSATLLRRYVYRIEPREGALGGQAYDFTVTEYYGRRVTVVCRVSVSDIEVISPITKENRKQIFDLVKGKRVFRYTASLWPEEQFLLTVRDQDDTFYLYIVANSQLLALLKQCM